MPTSPDTRLSDRRFRQRPSAGRPLHVQLTATGERLGEVTESLGHTMASGDFRDHLSVIGGGAKQLRFERNYGDRFALERPREIGGLISGRFGTPTWFRQ